MWGGGQLIPLKGFFFEFEVKELSQCFRIKFLYRRSNPNQVVFTGTGAVGHHKELLPIYQCCSSATWKVFLHCSEHV